jgi:cell division septation protein DedD
MKTLFNKKKLIVISFSLLFVNTCMAEESQSPWKKADAGTTKEDCVNCYADLNLDDSKPKVKVNVPNSKKEKVYVFSDAGNESKVYNNNGYTYKITETDTNPQALTFNDKVFVERKTKVTAKKVAIQVGAFRHYAGAKKYVKKYAILSSKYKVTIKTGAKNQKPLYRVQIEGFASKSQAKEFKQKYGLAGAFLVMK